MKNYLKITAAMLLMACSMAQAKIERSVKQILPGLEAVYKRAQNKGELPGIIKKYHAQAQKGKYEIAFEDFVELYEEICKIQAKHHKRNI